MLPGVRGVNAVSGRWIDQLIILYLGGCFPRQSTGRVIIRRIAHAPRRFHLRVSRFKRFVGQVLSLLHIFITCVGLLKCETKWTRCLTEQHGMEASSFSTASSSSYSSRWIYHLYSCITAWLSNSATDCVWLKTWMVYNSGKESVGRMNRSIFLLQQMLTYVFKL